MGGNGPKSQSSPGISSDYELNSINKDPANPGASSGRKLFETIGCVGCHTVNGQGGNVGPNLSDEANKGRTRQWLTTQIENPRTNDPQSIMPAYNNLSAEQISDLVDYLLSLSGQSNSNVSMQHVTQVKAKNTNPSLSEAGQEWSEICGQCHNLRPPSEYDDSQWIAAVDQMRLLVPLTGQEQSDILEFLKANN
jgi:mono/diheme cytochrome c family protein